MVALFLARDLSSRYHLQFSQCQNNHATASTIDCYCAGRALLYKTKGSAFLLFEFHCLHLHSTKMSSDECSAPLGEELLSSSNVFTTMIFGLFVSWLLLGKLQQWNVLYHAKLLLEYLFVSVPLIDVEMTPAESSDDGVRGEPAKSTDLRNPKRPRFIQCYDPSTNQFLGEVPAMNKEDVHDLCERAAAAQKTWAQTTFAQRRQVLRTVQRYVVHHVGDICRVASRDSGKPKVDALLGEVLTTCEKIRTINQWGEVWLRPSYRPTGPLMMHKTPFVEYVPFGVIGSE